MRFTTAFASLVSVAASVAVDAKVNANVGHVVDAKVNANVGRVVDAKVNANVGHVVDAKVNANVGRVVDAKVNANVGHVVDAKVNANVGRVVDAKVDADVSHIVNARTTADANVDVNVNVDANIDLGNKIAVEADVDVNVALGLAAGFQCPASMVYCPWLKSCSCLPGQVFDLDTNVCVGTLLTGAWPKPNCQKSGITIAQGAFCAINPTQFVGYDAQHPWCQVGINTITFCAEADIEVEITALGLGVDLSVEIDVEAQVGISADLRSTCAGLAALYIEVAADAVVLYNTNAFGLAVVAADVEVSLASGIFAKLSVVACLLGLGQCQVDCVSYCVKGCKNYIDVPSTVGGVVGGRLVGFVGLSIVSGTIYIVDSAASIVSLVVNDILCLVGSLLKDLVTIYNCTCHN